MRRATPSTRIVRLDVSGFRYRAGQAAEIGPEGSTTLAPYSLASAPNETLRSGAIEFLIKVDAHGRWGENFEPLRRGLRLRIKGPSGSFVIPDKPIERHFLFIAGGTGIAPLRAMIRQAHGVIPGVYRLLYSARTPNDFAYRRELSGMARRHEIALTLTVTGPAPTRWRGQHGRIAAAHLAALIDDPATLCFVCGPTAMVEDVPRLLCELGIERGRIRIEEW